MNTEDLTKRMTDLVETYEATTNPKAKYKAENQICRIADRLGNNPVVYSRGAVYIPRVERDGDFRIPNLKVVLTQKDLTKIALEHDRQSQKSTVSLEIIPGISSEDLYEGRAFGVLAE